MKGGLNKEEVEIFSQIGRDKKKTIVDHKEEEEGIEMETKLENEKKQKIVRFSDDVQLDEKILVLGSQLGCSMGTYDKTFRFDNTKVDTH